MIKWLLVILLNGIIWLPSQSQDFRSVAIDSTVFIERNRSFSEDHIEKYINQPEYSYRKSILYETNVFKRYWNSFKRWLSKTLGLSKQAGLDTLIFYLVMFLALMGLIYHLLRTTYDTPWKRSQKALTDEEQILISHRTTDQEFINKIKSSEEAGDLRTAIRFRFIQVVWKLNQVGIIKWQPELTNYQISRMIRSPEIRSEFKALTSIYEHIWYGKYPIDKGQQYNEYRSVFDQFIDKKITSL